MASYEYRLPDRLESLEVTLPAETAVQSRTGFEAVDDRTYAWDNETDGPIAPSGSLIFADTGDWAPIRQPPTDTVGAGAAMTPRSSSTQPRPPARPS